MEMAPQVGDPCVQPRCHGTLSYVAKEITGSLADTVEKIESECSVCKKRVTRYEGK